MNASTSSLRKRRTKNDGEKPANPRETHTLPISQELVLESEQPGEMSEFDQIKNINDACIDHLGGITDQFSSFQISSNKTADSNSNSNISTEETEKRENPEEPGARTRTSSGSTSSCEEESSLELVESSEEVEDRVTENDQPKKASIFSSLLQHFPLNKKWLLGLFLLYSRAAPNNDSPFPFGCDTGLNFHRFQPVNNYVEQTGIQYERTYPVNDYAFHPAGEVPSTSYQSTIPGCQTDFASLLVEPLNNFTEQSGTVNGPTYPVNDYAFHQAAEVRYTSYECTIPGCQTCTVHEPTEQSAIHNDPAIQQQYAQKDFQPESYNCIPPVNETEQSKQSQREGQSTFQLDEQENSSTLATSMTLPESSRTTNTQDEKRGEVVTSMTRNGTETSVLFFENHIFYQFKNNSSYLWRCKFYAQPKDGKKKHSLDVDPNEKPKRCLFRVTTNSIQAGTVTILSVKGRHDHEPDVAAMEKILRNYH